MSIRMKTMKWIPAVFAGAVLIAGCNSSGTHEEPKAEEIPLEQMGEQPVGRTIIPGSDSTAASLELASDSYDFGVIKEGEKVEHEFRFTNTGKSPLIIDRKSTRLNSSHVKISYAVF